MLLKNLCFLTLSFILCDSKLPEDAKKDSENVKKDPQDKKSENPKTDEVKQKTFDEVIKGIKLKKPVTSTKKPDEIRYVVNFGTETMFSINVSELMQMVWAESRGQIINLLGKRKELDAAIRKAFKKLFEQKKVLSIVKILVNSGKIPAADYNSYINHARAKKLAQILPERMELSVEDLSASKQQLLNEPQATYTGFYAVVNKETQARDVIRYFELGTAIRRSSAEVFIEGASQYALVKSLEEGYPASESEISSKFGNEILDCLNEMREGGCSKPIKKGNRWFVIWLKEKGTSKINESTVYSHALSTKIDPVVSEALEIMKKDGSIEFLVSDFNESDLEESEKYARPVLKIKEYMISNQDLRRFLESMLQKKSLKELVMQYNNVNRPAVLNYFFKTATDVMISVYVKSIIAKNLGVEIDSVEIEHNESEKLFMKYVRSLINDKTIRERFESEKDSIPKTRILADYITLESKKVADNIVRLLLTEQEKQAGEREFSNLFNKMKEDYSIDDNTMFDERISQVKDFFGQIEPMERNKTKADEPMRGNTIYLFRNNKTNLYHIVLVKNVNDDTSIDYEERRREILSQMIDEKIKSIYEECKCSKTS